MFSFLAFVLVPLVGQITICSADNSNNTLVNHTIPCLPLSTDQCFKNSSQQFNQLILHDNEVDVTDEAVLPLCRTWADSIKCAKDVIGVSDCQMKNVDSIAKWFQAITQIKDYLCDVNLDFFKDVLARTPCWNILELIQCAAKKSGFENAVTFSIVPLNSQTCQIVEENLVDCHMEMVKDIEEDSDKRSMCGDHIKEFEHFGDNLLVLLLSKTQCKNFLKIDDAEKAASRYADKRNRNSGSMITSSGLLWYSLIAQVVSVYTIRKLVN